MKIEFLINEKYKEPQILICNNTLTEKIKEVAGIVSQAVNATLSGYTENGVEMLPCDSVIRIYTENQKVFAQTKENTYVLRSRLYELENELDKRKFIRISNSEIVNIRKIRRLDTSVTGTIRMYLQGEIETYASRRNVTKIKKLLEL